MCEIRDPGIKTVGNVTSAPKLLWENLPVGKVVGADTFTEASQPPTPPPHPLTPSFLLALLTLHGENL